MWGHKAEDYGVTAVDGLSIFQMEHNGSSTLAPLIRSSTDSIEEDAGTKFVLESKGTWVHAGYHLTSATAGPPLLALPFAMAALGWMSGIVALIVAAAISFYASYSLSLTVEKLEAQGKRCLRFWDVALHVIGPSWAYYVVAPLQYLGCFIVVVALILLGGQTLEGIFAEVSVHNHLTLYEYTIIFGAFTLLLSQLPSFHSLRYFNLLSMLLCLGFSICSIIGSIISGLSPEAPPKDYSVQGSPLQIMFGVFNSISVMITAYANPLIVEIQATLAPPITGKMLKGLLICYSVALATFFLVAISGYWAFGNGVEGVVFTSMEPLVPLWLYILGNALACLQLIVATVVYFQPMFAKYEGMVVDVNAGRFSLRNVLPRFLGRSLLVGIAVLLATMLPFFTDFSALMGAFGFVPLCIIFPLVFHTLVFGGQTIRWNLVHWFNIVIIGLSMIVTIIGTIAAIRQIVLDVNTYSLFPST